VALLLAMLLGETLPSALILPAMALGLFTVSIGAMAASYVMPGRRRETARLAAAIAVALAITASVLTDVHQLLPYLR
jgi:Mn2+/Fe2+ NRAMP family transporter